MRFTFSDILNQWIVYLSLHFLIEWNDLILSSLIPWYPCFLFHSLLPYSTLPSSSILQTKVSCTLHAHVFLWGKLCLYLPQQALTQVLISMGSLYSSNKLILRKPGYDMIACKIHNWFFVPAFPYWPCFLISCWSVCCFFFITILLLCFGRRYKSRYHNFTFINPCSPTLISCYVTFGISSPLSSCCLTVKSSSRNR